METKNIIEFFTYCDENNIKPWLWDFKNCYSNNLTQDNITNMLKYKNGELVEITKFNITKKIGRSADCDKEAIYFYKVLGWLNSEYDILKGETINSFKTTFTQTIINSFRYKNIYGNIGINLNEYLDQQYPILYNNQNFTKFEIINNNLDSFQLFATLTHTIGNFTILPYWMNTGRYSFSKDYWDLTLLSIKDWLDTFSPEAWKRFVETYYLQPYVNSDYKVQPLWNGHSFQKIYPNNEDFPIFLRNVNERVEERGKYIIKEICDKINKKDFNFYKEIENINKLKFSDEF